MEAFQTLWARLVWTYIPVYFVSVVRCSVLHGRFLEGCFCDQHEAALAPENVRMAILLDTDMSQGHGRRA